MSFSTEIWNPALDRKKPSIHSHDVLPTLNIQPLSSHHQSAQNPSPTSELPPKRNLLYRIFHFHEEHHNSSSSSNHSDGGSQAIPTHAAASENWGRPRRSHHSDSEDDDHHSSSSVLSRRSSASNKTQIKMANKAERRPKSASDKKTMFHFGSSGSDSESEAEQELFPKTTRKSSIFKDFLHKPGKGRKTSVSSNADSHSDGTTSCGSSSRSCSDTEDNEVPKSTLTKSISHSESYNNLFKGLMLGNSQKKAAAADSTSPPHSPLLRPESEAAQIKRSLSETSLAEKYGKKDFVIGKGGQAVVRLCCPLNSTKKYAVKEFRKRRKDESQKAYVKKLIAEFCISSSLEDINVVKTIDLIQDEKHQWCVVMEYCSGGDLYTRIHDGTLTDRSEVNCYFKQLVTGVKYLHSMGVAHKDLKPENLLLDTSQKILKITDFGVSEVFRAPFCSLSRKSKGCCGSGPYIAPEEFEKGEYDSERVDVWATGIIYYIMVFGAFPWKCAKVSTDDRYKYYVDHYKKFGPIDRLAGPLRSLIYQILSPDVENRITITGITENNWFKNIGVCHDSEGNDVEMNEASAHVHKRSTLPTVSHH